MEENQFEFIDLFSGIGGFRLAFESLGGRCVFSSDIDKWANETYYQNFGEYPKGDITSIDSGQIPNHDVLCGGFPCQPFSIGGRRLGFSDTRGTLFFEIERIIKDKKPRAFLLENVKGLVNHDNGNTFLTIKSSLERLGYSVFFKLLNSNDFGVPQNRERIFIVGFDKKVDFKFPKPTKKINALSILEKNVVGHNLSEIALTHLSNHYTNFLIKKKLDENNSLFATEIRPSRCVFRNDGCSPCLTAKMGTGGNNVPVVVNEKRKLTVRECLRLQGFPENFKMKDNCSQSYKQIGNSVTIPVVQSIAKEMVVKMNTNKMKLGIDALPTTTHKINLRSQIRPCNWIKLKEKCRSDANYRCEICGSDGKNQIFKSKGSLNGTLNCHEMWDYDDKNHIQKLVRLIALCNDCHLFQHRGFAGIMEIQGYLDMNKLIGHFVKVNGVDRDVFKKQDKELSERCTEREKYQWVVDMSYARSLIQKLNLKPEGVKEWKIKGKIPACNRRIQNER